MNEPKRLIFSGSKRVRALVEAGKSDLPDEHLEAAVLGALGLGATGGAGLVGSSATHNFARSAMTRFFDGLGHVALSKVGIGLIVSATAASTGYLAVRVHEHGLRHGTKLASPASPSASVATVALTPSSVSSEVGLEAAATSLPAVRDPARTVAKGPTKRRIVSADTLGSEQEAAERHSESSTPSMSAQLQSIRRARAFVEASNAQAAIAELDAYEARCPHGTFEEEEIALRVQALRVAGDSVGAARALRSLQSRFPQSVHLAALALEVTPEE